MSATNLWLLQQIFWQEKESERAHIKAHFWLLQLLFVWCSVQNTRGAAFAFRRAPEKPVCVHVRRIFPDKRRSPNAPKEHSLVTKKQIFLFDIFSVTCFIPANRSSINPSTGLICLLKSALRTGMKICLLSQRLQLLGLLSRVIIS